MKKNHTYEQRKAYRFENEKLIFYEFWKWMNKQKLRKGSRFETDAGKYVQNRKADLMIYLEDAVF